MRFLLCWLPLAFVAYCSLIPKISCSSTYRLAPEDGISISVLRHPEFSGDYLVPPDGSVNLPAIGMIQINGKTIDEVQQYVTEQLRRRLVKPQVTVAIRTLRMQRVYILGAVAKPGVYDLKSDWRITEALATAGGLTKTTADCRAVLLRGATGEQVNISLSAALAGEAQADLLLGPGDVLSIDAIELLPVFVMGDVKNPGMYELRAGLGVVQALAQAGGLIIPQDEAHAIVIRGTQEVATVDLKAALVDGNSRANVSLQRGDVLRVSSLRSLCITVAGRVQHPGTYQLKNGDGIVESLTAAGGTLDNAALSHISLVHLSGVTENVNIAPAMLNGDVSANRRIQSGDLVLVPEVTAQITVIGFVNQPGTFLLPEGRQLTLVEAIGLAKGAAAKRSSIGKIAVLRMGKEQQQRMIIDVARYLKTGDLTQNPVIKSGDIIYVPETSRPDWEQIFQTISTFGIIRGMVG